MDPTNSENMRKRSANFSSREEVILLDLAKKYKDVIECKASDTRTHQQKSRCWERITTAFNVESGEAFRSKEVLKKKYENIKKRVKKKFADKKCYARGTGGGPHKDFTFTPLESQVIELLGTRVEGLASEFDGDAAMINDPNLDEEENIYDTVAKTSEIVDTNTIDIGTEVYIENADHDYIAEPSSFNENELPVNSDTCVNWSKYTPEMLKMKKSDPLQMEKSKGKGKYDETLTNKVSQWLNAKAAVEECKTTFLQEEQKLKLQQMKEKHEKELLLMESKAELEMSLLREEHNIKMEILHAQKNKQKKM